MYNLCSDQDVVVAPDPAPDRYRHIHFLSGPDSAPPAPLRLRPVVSRTGASAVCAPPAEAESLEPEAKRFWNRSWPAPASTLPATEGHRWPGGFRLVCAASAPARSQKPGSG